MKSTRGGDPKEIPEYGGIRRTEESSRKTFTDMYTGTAFSFERKIFSNKRICMLFSYYSCVHVFLFVTVFIGQGNDEQILHPGGE